MLPAAPYLTHRPPLLLVDEVALHSEHTGVVQLTVRDASPFGDGRGFVPAHVGVEYLAQAIAALSGLRRAGRGLAPVVGLLVGSRRYAPAVPRFAHGARLTVRVEERMNDPSGLSAYACRLEAEDGALLASAEIKTYEPPSFAHYLETHP